jgi:hypothetical protein
MRKSKKNCHGMEKGEAVLVIGIALIRVVILASRVVMVRSGLGRYEPKG